MVTQIKRVLVSILCGIVLFFSYYFFILIFLGIYKPEIETLLLILKPISFPVEIYGSILGKYPESGNVVAVMNIGGSILTFSIPFYLALSFFAKLKKKSKVEKEENPPEPPVFREEI